MIIPTKREANWWDDPWIPVRVDTLRALLDCAEALKLKDPAHHCSVYNGGACDGCIEASEKRSAALAALDALEGP